MTCELLHYFNGNYLLKDQFKDIINEVLKKNDLTDSSIKIIITGGISIDGFSLSNPTIVVLNMPLVFPQEENYTKGISLLTQEYTRDYPTIKSTYYDKALSLPES